MSAGGASRGTSASYVRLPDELVEYVDSLVAAGSGSRAAVVTRALTLHRQQLVGERDARILEVSGDYDDFDDMVRHASIDACRDAPRDGRTHHDDGEGAQYGGAGRAGQRSRTALLVVSCDNIITIDKAALGRHVGFLFERQEHDLAAAIVSAFALRTDNFV